MCMRTIKQKVNYTERTRSPNRGARGQGWCESFYGSVEISAGKKPKNVVSQLAQGWRPK